MDTLGTHSNNIGPHSLVSLCSLFLPSATSLMDLWNTPGVAEKVEETARVYFANSILTINLIPALLVGALLLFCE